MTADPVDDVPPLSRNEASRALFLSAVQDLAKFAHDHELNTADTLLAELLAVLYQRKP